MIDQELNRKAKALLDSPFFTNHVDQGYLAEKQCIFLTLCGKKAVSEASSSKWITTKNGGHSEPENEDKLCAFLSSLGLAYSLRNDEYATNALVSFDQRKITECEQAGDDWVKVGQLFGYPMTAVNAFDKDTVLDNDKQDILMEKAGLPLYMPQFRFSQDHASEELEVLKDWYTTLKKYNLVEES